MIRTHIAVLGLAIILLMGCGVQEDSFQCRDLCDRQALCNPALADSEWDTCHADCQTQGYEQELVDCVLTRECENSIEAMIESCLFDPLAAVEP